jgi:hypothetical protein
MDLVVCEPIENPFTSPRISSRLIQAVRFDTREVQDGVPVAFTGFPLEYVFPITSKGNIGGKVAFEKSDTIFDYIIDKVCVAWSER